MKLRFDEKEVDFLSRYFNLSFETIETDLDDDYALDLREKCADIESSLVLLVEDDRRSDLDSDLDIASNLVDKLFVN